MLKKYFYGKHYIDKNDILEINKSLKNQLSQGPYLNQLMKKFQNILMLNFVLLFQVQQLHCI